MKASLLYDLARVFRVDAEAIVQPYERRAPMTDEERREVDRLEATARSIRYRGDVAAYEEA